MAGKRRGLGKGVNNLIPVNEESNPDSGEKSANLQKASAGETANQTTETKENVREVVREVVKEVVKNEPLLVKISQIEPNANQPRKKFDDESLEELAGSIKQYGMIQPIIVQQKGKYYEIIAGERRWRAAQLAGLKEVPVLVKDYADKDTLELALIENIQRQDLNPIEEALAYRRLLEEYHLTQEEVADRVSKSRTAVTNAMRLLKLCAKVQEMVEEGEISGGHARALVTVENEEDQVALADKIRKKKLSVRETEKLVKSYQKSKETGEKQITAEDDSSETAYMELEERLRTALGTKVTIRRKTDGTGVISIEYYSLDELERLAESIQSVESEKIGEGN